MKPMHRKPAERLGEALQQTFSKRERIDTRPSEIWTRAVMAEIRRVSARGRPSDFWTLFENVAWRFIPVAIALIVLLGVAFTRIEPPSGNLVADIFDQAALDGSLYAYDGR